MSFKFRKSDRFCDFCEQLKASPVTDDDFEKAAEFVIAKAMQTESPQDILNRQIKGAIVEFLVNKAVTTLADKFDAKPIQYNLYFGDYKIIKTSYRGYEVRLVNGEEEFTQMDMILDAEPEFWVFVQNQLPG